MKKKNCIQLIIDSIPQFFLFLFNVHFTGLIVILAWWSPLQVIRLLIFVFVFIYLYYKIKDQGSNILRIEYVNIKMHFKHIVSCPILLKFSKDHILLSMFANWIYHRIRHKEKIRPAIHPMLRYSHGFNIWSSVGQIDDLYRRVAYMIYILAANSELIIIL